MPEILTRQISNPAAMQELARYLCENHLPDKESFTLFLEGDLGAGKTFMAQEILKLKGVKEAITSPTYALVNEYLTDSNTFGHWDFYRLESPNDFFARGFQDFAGEPNSVHLVEWPEKINAAGKLAFSGSKFTLKISFGSSTEARNIQFNPITWFLISYF